MVAGTQETVMVVPVVAITTETMTSSGITMTAARTTLIVIELSTNADAFRQWRAGTTRPMAPSKLRHAIEARFAINMLNSAERMRLLHAAMTDIRDVGHRLDTQAS